MRWLAGFVVAVAISACAAVNPGASQQQIPWEPLAPDLSHPVPQAQSLPVPPGTPACSAGELLGGVVGSQGATGHVITSIVFSGSGTRDCFLDGVPSVTLLDLSGRDLGFRQHSSFMPALVEGPALVNPGPRPEMHIGPKVGQAAFNIDWTSQPEACPGQSGSLVAAARIQVPGGGSVSVPIPTEPAGYACQGVGVSKFEGPALAVAAPTPPPLPAVAVSAPSSAKAGHRFEFTVTLTNNAQAPMDLMANCPNYDEELIAAGGLPLGGKHYYKLNCDPAGTLAAGKSARFQMLLDVPSNAAAGDYQLVFLLDYWNSASKTASEHLVHIGG